MRRWTLLALVVTLTGCPPEPSSRGATPPPPVTELVPVDVTAPPVPPPPVDVTAPPPPEEGAPPQQAPMDLTAPPAPWVGLVYGPRAPGFTDGVAIVVKNVVTGSPAAEAGIRPGEGILRVDGLVATGPDQLQKALDSKKLGDTLELALLSPDGTERIVAVRVSGFDRAVIAPRAMASGARFLAERVVDQGWQRKGSEDLGVDVALSSLCVKALVEAPTRGDHVATIDTAVALLLAHQTPEGAIMGAPDRHHYRTYATSLALQSLARLGSPAHRPQQDRLRDFLIEAQLDDAEGFSDYDFPFFGAWNYYDQNRRATIRADVSATAYATEALMRAGVPTSGATANNALMFLGRCQNLPVAGASAEELALLDGGFSFAPRDSKAGRVVLGADRVVYRSYGSSTADGLRTMLALGVPRSDPRVVAAVAWLGKNFTLRVNPGFPRGNDGVLERGIYYYYLDALTDALSRAGVETLTGEKGQAIRWRDEVARRLVSMQRADGSWAGDVAVMNEDDPAQATAFALLSLTRCVGGRP